MNTESPMLWCPRLLRESKDLNPTEKWIFIDILNLTTIKGYCYATNEYLANYNEVDKRTVERTLKKLTDLGYIHVEGQGKRRKIFLLKFAIFATNLSQNCDKNVAPINNITNNIYLSNLNIKRDNNTHARTSEQCVSQKKKKLRQTGYSDKQLQFHKAFPRRIADDIQVPDKIDMQLLIDSINRCPWLKEHDNMSLKSCINNYELIITGAYKQDGDEWDLSSSKQQTWDDFYGGER